MWKSVSEQKFFEFLHKNWNYSKIYLELGVNEKRFQNGDHNYQKVNVCAQLHEAHPYVPVHDVSSISFTSETVFVYMVMLGMGPLNGGHIELIMSKYEPF